MRNEHEESQFMQISSQLSFCVKGSERRLIGYMGAEAPIYLRKLTSEFNRI